MSYNNKVNWSEGMFLNVQHFQQQERYLEELIDARVSSVGAYAWGLAELEINQKLLGQGQVYVTMARGVMPDGTPFDFPRSDNPPAVIELPRETRQSIVYLCLPVTREGALNFADEGTQNLARYISSEHEVRDISSDAGDAAAINVGKLNFRLLLETDDLSGYVRVGLMRVSEVDDNNSIVLGDSYIPTCLDCKKSPGLSGYLTEVIGLLHSRGEAIAGRLADVNRGTTATIEDRMLLQLVNRLESLTKHMAQINGVHPVSLYAQLVQMVGELSTFFSQSKRPVDFPGYRHHDLQSSFAPVVAAIRGGFQTVGQQSAVSLELVEKVHGIRVAEIPDHSLVGSAIFVLAAKADLHADGLRTHLPAQVRIAPVEHIKQLIDAALPGIALHPLAAVPPDVPSYAGFSYFQLDPQSELWNVLNPSSGLAIQVSGGFPNLRLEFWAVRH